MRLQVRLLAPFEACTETGAVVRLPTRKAAALLAVLAARPGERHGREQLATLLWPESGEAQWRASLRQTLSLLRHALGAAAWLGSPGGKDVVSSTPPRSRSTCSFWNPPPSPIVPPSWSARSLPIAATSWPTWRSTANPSRSGAGSSGSGCAISRPRSMAAWWSPTARGAAPRRRAAPGGGGG